MQQQETIYDIGIIGGGPAGYTAAFQARKQGLSVVLFEKDKIGGVCLNKGCIPTKAILHSAELYEEMKCAQDLGISAENLSFDYEKIVEHKDQVVEKLRKNLELALKNAGVKVVYGEAKQSTPSCPSDTLPVGEGRVGADTVNSLFTVHCSQTGYICKKIIVATGSEPKDFPTLKFDHEFVLNSDDILNLKKLPKNILIIGSGAIGIEWARIFSAFDVEVSIVETAEHLLPLADIEVSKRIERIFKSKKIKMYLSNTVEKITAEPPLSKVGGCEADGGILIASASSPKGKVYLKSGEILEPELILLAVGRKPVGTAKLEEQKSGDPENSQFTCHCEGANNSERPSQSQHYCNINEITTSKPAVSSRNANKNNPSTICIGDACGKIQLAHFAIKQAIKEISGIDFDETLVPSVVYGNPEIAWVGKREQDLEEGTYQKSNLLISALGKSHCDNSTDGFIKILSQNGKIIGAHIVSKEASSLIQQITIAMQNNIAIDDLKKVCFAHPTYSEGLFESLFR